MPKPPMAQAVEDANDGQIIKSGPSDGLGAMFLPSVAEFAYGWL